MPGPNNVNGSESVTIFVHDQAQEKPWYGDGHHGAVSFSNDIWTISSPIEATTLVIEASWLKAVQGGAYPLILRATESITILGGCLFTACGNNGKDAVGVTPGSADSDNSWLGQGAGGAGDGAAGGYGTGEGLGTAGTNVIGRPNFGGWSSPVTTNVAWNEAQPQQGGNGGTTGGADEPVVGGVPRGTYTSLDITNVLLRNKTDGFLFGLGGCGGSGGNGDGVGISGGGGQGGGGGSAIILSAPRIIIAAGAYVQRDVTGGAGGRGGDAVGGNCGGGGGGAGGNCGGIFDITESWEVDETAELQDYYYSLDGRAAGGANGAGSGTGTSGSSGADGLVGRTYLINPATMTFVNRD